MIKNDIEIDTKIKCLEAKMTQQQLGEAVGTTGQYVNRIIKKKDGVVNKTFVQMMEALGYDIVLTYEKRSDSWSFYLRWYYGKVCKKGLPNKNSYVYNDLLV